MSLLEELEHADSVDTATQQPDFLDVGGRRALKLSTGLGRHYATSAMRAAADLADAAEWLARSLDGQLHDDARGSTLGLDGYRAVSGIGLIAEALTFVSGVIDQLDLEEIAGPASADAISLTSLLNRLSILEGKEVPLANDSPMEQWICDLEHLQPILHGKVSA